MTNQQYAVRQYQYKCMWKVQDVVQGETDCQLCNQEIKKMVKNKAECSSYTKTVSQRRVEIWVKGMLDYIYMSDKFSARFVFRTFWGM